MKRVYLLGILLIILGYLWYTGQREHLTPGPPTLASLQADTQDLQNQLNTLNTQFQQMQQQASEGANAAAAARLQVSAVKNS
jgi:hypothetical protein